MATQDKRSKTLVRRAFNADISSDTNTDGDIIDTAKYDLGIVFTFDITTFADGNYALQVFESDDSGMSGATQVAGDQLIPGSTAPELDALTAAGAVLTTIGVISNLRFLRARVVSTNTTSGATVIGSVVLGPELMPDPLLTPAV